MDTTDKKLLKIQLYNQCNGGKVITWTELLKIMADTFGRDRDAVFQGMNELIDEGKIVLPKPDTYCFPETTQRIETRQQNTAEITRTEFDKLTHMAKAECCNNGGRII
ncbi:MAG: hypothetical protein LBH43_14800 [Treponema sp.]|jgi:hypothetical protein|nr:hypothetical protein [Treponema sp.]